MFAVLRRDRNEPLTLAEAIEIGNDRKSRLLVNGKSRRAAVQLRDLHNGSDTL